MFGVTSGSLGCMPNASIAGTDEDPGRYAQRKVPIVQGAFKTPTLRDVALTAPYMHRGIYTSLEDVVEHYDRGGDVKDNLSPNIAPLNRSAQDKADLVALLKSLMGAPARIELPQFPQWHSQSKEQVLCAPAYFRLCCSPFRFQPFTQLLMRQIIL